VIGAGCSTDHSSLKANDYLKQKPEEESPGQV